VARSQDRFLNDESIIRLTPELFKARALVFKNLKSLRVALKSDKSPRRVTMNFAGFPYLGIWSHWDGAPFVCLEPWHGIADAKDASGDLAKKEGIERLAPGHSFHCEYSVTFE